MANKSDSLDDDPVDEEDIILLEATSSSCDDEVIVTTHHAHSERNETWRKISLEKVLHTNSDICCLSGRIGLPTKTTRYFTGHGNITQPATVGDFTKCVGNRKDICSSWKLKR